MKNVCEFMIGQANPASAAAKQLFVACKLPAAPFTAETASEQPKDGQNQFDWQMVGL